MSAYQCTNCDRGEHTKCDGTVTVMDQDGRSRYICQCYHRRSVLEAQRIEAAEGRVRRLIRDVGLGSTHELVRRAPPSPDREEKK